MACFTKFFFIFLECKHVYKTLRIIVERLELKIYSTKLSVKVLPDASCADVLSDIPALPIDEIDDRLKSISIDGNR